jgi:hypothetical protein
MKCLSFTQPWLGAILHWQKRIENRQRWQGCSYRGPILLHAAKGIGSIDEFDDIIISLLHDMGVPIEYVQAELATFGPRRGHSVDVWSPHPKLARGGIVGRARIVGTVRSERDVAAYEANVKGAADQRKWWQGGFALVLEDVEPMPFVPWSGALGLFEVDEQKLPEGYRAA